MHHLVLSHFSLSLRFHSHLSHLLKRDANVPSLSTPVRNDATPFEFEIESLRGRRETGSRLDFGLGHFVRAFERSRRLHESCLGRKELNGINPNGVKKPRRGEMEY